LASAALVGLLSLGAAALAFGSAVPQTAEAKSIFLRQGHPSYGLTQSSLVALSGAGAAWLGHILLRPKPIALRAWLLASSLVLTGALIYLGLRNQLVSTRYSSYLCFPWTVSIVWILALRCREHGLGKREGAAILALLACCLVVAARMFPATRVSEPEQLRPAFAKIVALTDESSRVALSEVGLVGFYTERYVVDLVGLVDSETIAWGREHGRPKGQADFEALLMHRGATHYIATYHERAIEGERLVFEPLADFECERNNLSAGMRTTTWRLYALHRREHALAHAQRMPRLSRMKLTRSSSQVSSVSISLR
jgi:hypothetical protein